MPNFKNIITRHWYRLDESWRFAITAFIIARIFYAIWSWVVVTMQPVAIQNFELSGEPILSIVVLEQNQAYTYLREVNGEILTFEVASPGTLIDRQTGSFWKTSNGTAIQGPLAGVVLSPAKTLASEIFPYHEATRHTGSLLSLWQRFDANWYVSVAEHGYGRIAGDDHFPPFYPLLVRVLRPVFGSAFLAGLFLSHVASLLALKFLYDTFLGWGEKKIGRRAFLFFIIYPTFFFFFSAYSEPVFLVVVLLSFKAMHNRSWAWAGFWTFCAILTRLQGAALFVPLIYLLWQDRPFLQKPAHLMGLGVPGLGGLFYLYLRSLQVTDGAIPFVEAEWHARLVPPWKTYGYAVQTILSGNFTFIDFLNWFVVSLFIVLLIWGWRRLPLEYNLYSAFSLFIMLIRIVETQPLISMSRYSLTLFPCFYVLSLAGEHPLLRRVILYTSFLLSLYLSAQFFTWGWVA